MLQSLFVPILAFFSACQISRRPNEKGQPLGCPFSPIVRLRNGSKRLRPPPPPPPRWPRPPPPPPPRLPPLPPPPKPSRLAIGLASLTVKVRPSSCVPF